MNYEDLTPSTAAILAHRGQPRLRGCTQGTLVNALKRTLTFQRTAGLDRLELFDGSNSMRWAVFSNVHANLPALQSVLSDLGKKRVRQIYCLGDLVGCGPFPAETLQSLRANKVVCIRGSADTRVLAARRKSKNNRLENWTLQRLTAQDIAFLRALPARVQLHVHGKAVLMVHGSRCPDGEYVPDSSEKDDLKETLARSDSQVLISGGSREPFVRNLKNGWVINCGSLGRNLNGAGIAHYALVSITGSGVRVTMQEAHYSREALLRAAVRRDFPLEPSSIVRPAIEEEGSTETLMQGVTAALRSLERAFSRTLQAVMKHQDPENVRELRIGASRLLLALMMFSPPRKQRYFVKALKRLRKAASDLRELDILLQHVVAAGPELQPAHAGGLAGFMDELASQREIAKNSLTAELKHKRTARLVNGLNKQIRGGFRAPGQHPNGIEATRSIRADFHRIIKKIALRAAADLECTHNVLQQAEFHDLRITSKKLRYTLEIFQKATGSDYSAEVCALRDFQKLMGSIHDFDTSTELLASLQHRLRRKLAPQDLRAADFLAFVFQKERVTMFGRFLEVSHDFAASRFFNSLIPDPPNI